MSSPISVGVQAMLQAVSELESKHTDIRTQVIGVQNEFDSLSSTWTGEAATGFQNAMGQFYEECNTVLMSLQRLAQDVTTSAINYEKHHNMSVDEATALQRQVNATPAGLPNF